MILLTQVCDPSVEDVAAHRVLGGGALPQCPVLTTLPARCAVSVARPELERWALLDVLLIEYSIFISAGSFGMYSIWVLLVLVFWFSGWLFACLAF
jgi:hypothetical protein